MKRFIFSSILVLIAVTSFAQKLTKFVDPFLGTGGHGHVYPGATTPFGMVQLSPDNGTNGWDWCGGYHYSSDSIAGFSHMHLSGTGIGDWCDISVLPLLDTVGISAQYLKIPFSHKNEKAKPGYYSVWLGNNISCELTATPRNGYHRYKFPNKNGWLRFDMGFAINWDSPTAAMLKLVNDSTLVGYRASTGWAKGQQVFFAARFSKPVKEKIFLNEVSRNGDEITGPKVKAVLKFDTEDNTLLLRVALSTTGTDAALKALSETDRKPFDMVAYQAEANWEKELQKITIDTTDKAYAQKFYTALYRTTLSPNLYSDADGKYRVHNNKIRVQNGNKYTVFSNWDTFRALNPLFTIIQPQRVPEIVNSMLSFYEDNGLLPVWDLSTWETNTMTGYHSIPIIADAILKNFKGIDQAKAYEAMKKTAHQQQRGTPDYIRFGYLPQDKHGWSVTITLEYAYDDWCIAQVAKKLGNKADYDYFYKRAMSYKNLFDPKTGFMRAKDSTGKFIEPFDPLLSEHGFEGQYIEGTAWQHSFFVPQDVDGFAALYGGKPQLVNKIDALFSSSSELHGTNTSNDVSGLIGQYAHGNEPSHHIIYMYTALGEPTKSAGKIRLVIDSLYKNGPEGLPGNEDCGQMSAWLVWSSLGMYPLNPASGKYVFGYPMVNSAELHLPNGKKMTIRVKGQLVKKPGSSSYIKRVVLNGKAIPVNYITHEQLLKGGELTYELTD
ncbi:MAG TPA: GH92 family glycosyl hydrolase [Chitinophagaceae bacterium]|nr:GH92 family glycosyl hydrolase [Chitinophagaceae bacterium]